MNCVFVRKLVKLPSERKNAYSGFVAASMSVQPVSSVLCQIPLKKKNFCRHYAFLLFVGHFLSWLWFYYRQCRPCLQRGAACRYSTYNTYSTYRFFNTLEARLWSGFQENANIKKSQVAYQKIASGKMVTIYFYLLFVNDISHKIQPLPLIWFVSVSGCRM